MKQRMLLGAIMLLTLTSYAQTTWTIGLQNRLSFSQSQGPWEEQRFRAEGFETWLYGDMRSNRWAVRLGASYMRTDMGEGLVGWCATPPVMTYPMFQNRVGYRLAVGREFSLGKAGELTTWIEVQQHWSWDHQVYPFAELYLSSYIPPNPMYFGPNIGVEYTKTFWNHLTVGASIQGGFISNKLDSRMSPWKLSTGLSLGYRF